MKPSKSLHKGERKEKKKSHKDDEHGNSNTMRDLPQFITFLCSTVIKIPKGLYGLVVEAWGPGGGGAGTDSPSGGGGGAGGYLKASIPVKPGDIYSLTIPAGGAGGALLSPGNNGGNGIPTSFIGPGQTWSAGYGGGGGAVGATTVVPGLGGVAVFTLGGINGTASNGQNAFDGAGGTSTSGGTGGTSGISANVNGNFPGGGGAGGSAPKAPVFSPGNGGNGSIAFTYFAPKPLSFTL